MLIAILVLLGLAGAIWYFASKQTQTVTLSQEDVAASDPTIELKKAADVVKTTNENLRKMTKKIDEVLATDESAFTTPEVAAEKEAIQILQDELAKAQELAAAESKSTLVETPVVEAPKPAKKKRRYYPKKK